MSTLFSSRFFSILFATIAILLICLMVFTVFRHQPETTVTAVADTGTVRQLVSVSGIAEAEQTVELAFPTSGTVAEVFVEQGDVVAAGDILLTLDSRALEADRNVAEASLSRAIANRDELLAGPRTEARAVTSQTVQLRQEQLETTKATEERKIENAYRALLSNDLEAISLKYNEDATSPTISGTYTCEDTGAYTINIFNSSSASGYSYNLSGLESGTAVASTDQPIAIGRCGLRMQLDKESVYGNSEWTITVPNTASPSYITNLNTYSLVRSQAESAITLAEQEVVVAQVTATNANAPARSEAIARSNAEVKQAEAQLARIDATLADLTLRAPFSGTVTTIAVLKGETVTLEPIVTLLAEQAFDVTARIPEIDIGKLLVGQRVEMVFDAKPDTLVVGTVSYLSLKATEIDGVSYYEATVTFTEVPTWLRSGLNADIDIVVAELTNTVRVPSRFVIKTDTGYSVLKRAVDTISTTTIEVILSGNDGWTALSGLTDGDTVIAP
jgi:HlyD family secretion protein